VVTETPQGKKKKEKKKALLLLLGCKLFVLGVIAALVCGSRNVMWWLAKLQRPLKNKPAV
jgi:hypothetical protein